MKTALKIALPFVLSAVVGTAWSADIARGQRIYNLHCASCHGITGIPLTPQTPNLQMREGMNQPDANLLQTLKMGKGTMPPYLGMIKDQELLDVIQYIRMMR
jgi:cytochrome c6